MRIFFLIAAHTLPIFSVIGVSQTIAQDSDPFLQRSPSYSMPKSAIDAKISGDMTVAMRIDEKGQPKNVVVTTMPMWPCGDNPKKALEELFSTIKDAFIAAAFSPAIKDGKPVAKEIVFRITLKNPGVNDTAVEIDPATGKRRATRIISGVVNGRAKYLPKPSYPAEAKPNRDGGVVDIKVLIDEQGNVIRAGPVSGAITLQNAARDVACKARFAPTRLEGRPIKVAGVITYAFVP